MRAELSIGFKTVAVNVPFIDVDVSAVIFTVQLEPDVIDVAV
jgi:hypothetical protein